MTRLGVFGGSFNPPHRAHLAIARRAAIQADLNEVLWIPAATPPHKKDHDLAPAEHRFEMVRRLIADDPLFTISRIELDRGGTSFTVDTLDELHERYPESRLFLIIGGDSLRSFPSWHRPSRILEQIEKILVYRRPDDQADPPHERLEGHVEWLEGAPMDISSTEIRRSLAGPDKENPYVPAPVLAYIREYGLYLGT